MSHNSTVTQQLLHAGLQLEDVLDYLDELHTAASEGNFDSVDEQETLSVLRDIVYTATEAMREIEAKRVQKSRKTKIRQPILRIVEKIDKAG